MQFRLNDIPPSQSIGTSAEIWFSSAVELTNGFKYGSFIDRACFYSGGVFSELPKKKNKKKKKKKRPCGIWKRLAKGD